MLPILEAFGTGLTIGLEVGTWLFLFADILDHIQVAIWDLRRKPNHETTKTPYTSAD